MKKSLLLAVSVCVLCVLSGCGGGSRPSPLPLVSLRASASLVVLGQPVTVTWASLYADSCTASASPSESDWTGSEVLNGTQSVTPVSQGTITYAIVCTGPGGTTAPSTASVTATANTHSNLAITSGPLPDGIVGQEYGTLHTLRRSPIGIFIRANFFQLTASGGNGGPYTWSWAAAPGSSLPPSMECCVETFGSDILPPASVSVPDAVAGTPNAPGTYQVVVTVSDSASPPALTTGNFTLNINYPPPPVVNTTPAPAIGTLNVAYVGSTFTATDGLAPFTWSETGALPPGMSFSSGGVLTGTPTQAGSFNIAVGVQDSLGRSSAPQNFTIVVLAKGFTPTGSMGTGRTGHTATLLNNGKVLVTGGASTTADLATAELFDPTVGNFSPTGSMESTRISHTATLLNSGKLLVTGGSDAKGNALATAEIFDPASGIFATTGSMESPRYGHTAMLLSDGKVLVAGGSDGNNALATAELFDPATGTFTPSANMEAGRISPTATLLNNGKVLVTGGGSATAELFDPTTGSFSPTGSMKTVRTSYEATLLNSGKVLVTGGNDANGNPLATAEIFDPASGTFATTGSMGTARYIHTATLLSDGKVLVTGGLENASTPLSAAELFDPSSGTFAPTADMGVARAFHSATLLTNGEVLVTGGQGADAGSGTVLATAELYQ
jgi:Galactose oxidase, central domain/Kelch motif